VNTLTFITNIASNLKAFAAPEHCAVCNTLIEPSKSPYIMLCISCMNSLPYAPPSNRILNRFFENFDSDNVFISKATSLISLKDDDRYYNPIHYFKYEGFYKLAVEFGKLLGKRLKIENMIDYDYIIPVPIHKAKERERQYNQSLMIASGLSEFVKGKVSDRIVVRKKYTKSQTTLSKDDRLVNVGNIFTVSNNVDISGANILIIDDVLTTGATINAVARALVEARVLYCHAATVAIA